MGLLRAHVTLKVCCGFADSSSGTSSNRSSSSSKCACRLLELTHPVAMPYVAHCFIILQDMTLAEKLRRC